MKSDSVKQTSLIHITLLIFIAGLLATCTKEEFVTDSTAQLEFSLDTLTFDTVFTARGSATRSFLIRNKHDKFIRISRIWVDANAQSFFRMNVDGIAGIEISDVEIPANDSIWVFFEVTVDPDQPLSVSPFVIVDKVNFLTNGNMQSVVLEAWGQNANYLPDRFSGGQQRLFSCDMNQWIWDDPRPYVLFGALFIDSCELVIPEGTNIHIHGGFGRNSNGGFYNDGILYFFKEGRLTVRGTAENPVVIQGDRLEQDFAEVPGQWGRIQLGPLSKGHSINHAIIKNATIGLLVDSLAEVSITNTQVFNTTSSAVAGYQAKITAVNSLFHTSGGNNITFILGGDYDFSYCTLANYGTPSEALRATNFTCLDGTPLCTQPIAAPLNMVFRNSIIIGSSRDEISLADAVGDQDPSFFQYRFENCIVQVDELIDPEGFPNFFDFCDPCLNGETGNLFVDEDNWDFHLDSLSIAEEMAIPIEAIRTDLEGFDRDPERPDIGCYEYRN